VVLTAGLAANLIRVGRLEEAVERLRGALAVLGESEANPDVGALHAQLGRALAFLGRYEEAEPELEAALRVAAALELPELLVQALDPRAVVLGYRARVQEATALFRLAIEVAEANDLSDIRQRSLMNLGNISVQWDAPEAERYWEAALPIARRRGDRYAESMIGANYLGVLLTRGRWEDAERLAAELLDAAPDRPGREVLHWFMFVLQARRARQDAAEESFTKAGVRGEYEDVEYNTMFRVIEIIRHRLHGEHAAALQLGVETMDEAILHVGVASDPVRYGWSEVVGSALELGRLDDARALIERLASMPRGHVPPFMRAEVVRARGLLSAAEGRHDEVEADLRAAVGGLEALGYPYHLAVAQTDLARWLIDQGRRDEADRLLEAAVATLRRLGATPALAGAEALQATRAASEAVERVAP
jgi:tetratricopeptide (TPR) repeat protein